MKTSNRTIPPLISFLLLGCFCSLTVPRALSQCNFGPVTIVCHSAGTNTTTVCCSWAMDGQNNPYCAVAGSETRITTTGFVLTCGAGSTAQTTEPFTGTCAWTESGTSTCAGVAPWGPIPQTGPVALQNCIGSCG
jgi:hypothetical protein